MTPKIDVLLPTAKQPERLWNALCQTSIALTQGVETRVTVAFVGTHLPFIEQLPREWISTGRVRFWSTPSFFDTSPNVVTQSAHVLNHCLSAIPMDAEYLYLLADDDGLLPWGLRHLYDAAEKTGAAAVVGEALCVSRETHRDATLYKVGPQIIQNHVSGVCILWRRSALAQMGLPLFKPDHSAPDYELLWRIFQRFPVRKIRNTVCVLSVGHEKDLAPWLRTDEA